MIARPKRGGAASRFLFLGAAGALTMLSSLAAPPAAADPIRGEWVGRPVESFGRTTVHKLALETDGHTAKGELLVTLTMPVPLSSWIDRFCDGEETLEQAVRYRVTGEQQGNSLALRYQGPKVEACTCAGKCIVKDKSGSIDAVLDPGSGRLVWDDRVLYGAATTQVDGTGGAVEPPRADVSVAGAWTTTPSRSLDRTTTRLLDLREQSGALTGTYAERTSRPFPLSSWRDRFCGGSATWDMVEQWEVQGTRQQDSVELSATKGRIVACSCPGKCRTTTRSTTLELRVTADGSQLRASDDVYERARSAPDRPPPTRLPEPLPPGQGVDDYPPAAP